MHGLDKDSNLVPVGAKFLLSHRKESMVGVSDHNTIRLCRPVTD